VRLSGLTVRSIREKDPMAFDRSAQARASTHCAIGDRDLATGLAVSSLLERLSPVTERPPPASRRPKATSAAS